MLLLLQRLLRCGCASGVLALQPFKAWRSEASRRWRACGGVGPRRNSPGTWGSEMTQVRDAFQHQPTTPAPQIAPSFRLRAHTLPHTTMTAPLPLPRARLQRRNRPGVELAIEFTQGLDWGDEALN